MLNDPGLQVLLLPTNLVVWRAEAHYNTVMLFSKITGLLVGHGKKSQISRDFQGQIRGKNGRFHGNFAGIFVASFAEKRLVKERPISWKLPEQISVESDWFCAY